MTEIEKVVSEELAKLARTGPTPAELARARTKQEFAFVTALEGIGGFGGKSDRLNQYNVLLGDPGKLEWDMARYRDATVASVKQVVARYLDTKNRLLVRFRVEKSGRASRWRSTARRPPRRAPTRPSRRRRSKRRSCPTGWTSSSSSARSCPRSPSRSSPAPAPRPIPPGKAGLAQLTVTQLDMGTPTRKALEIEDALGDLGVAITGAAGRESARVSFEALERNLDPAMAIVSDVIRNASYPASEFDREKKRHLDTLAQQEKNANAVGARVRAILAFGPDHPDGRPVQGLPSTIEKLTREDLAKFHSDYWKPGSSALSSPAT